MPAFAGISVFRWDINIRESTVLGLVGAGGIGLQLNASINLLAWTQVSVILLVIIATVVVSEWVSAKVRHAIICSTEYTLLSSRDLFPGIYWRWRTALPCAVRSE